MRSPVVVAQNCLLSCESPQSMPHVKLFTIKFCEVDHENALARAVTQHRGHRSHRNRLSLRSEHWQLADFLQNSTSTELSLFASGLPVSAHQSLAGHGGGALEVPAQTDKKAAKCCRKFDFIYLISGEITTANETIWYISPLKCFV